MKQFGSTRPVSSGASSAIMWRSIDWVAQLKFRTGPKGNTTEEANPDNSAFDPFLLDDFHCDKKTLES